MIMHADLSIRINAVFIVEHMSKAQFKATVIPSIDRMRNILVISYDIVEIQDGGVDRRGRKKTRREVE